MFFEIVNGTVASGDSFPTTHGNTIGLIKLWDKIIYDVLGESMLIAEFMHQTGVK